MMGTSETTKKFPGPGERRRHSPCSAEPSHPAHPHTSPTWMLDRVYTRPCVHTLPQYLGTGRRRMPSVYDWLWPVQAKPTSSLENSGCGPDAKSPRLGRKIKKKKEKRRQQVEAQVARRGTSARRRHRGRLDRMGCWLTRPWARASSCPLVQCAPSPPPRRRVSRPPNGLARIAPRSRRNKVDEDFFFSFFYFVMWMSGAVLSLRKRRGVARVLKHASIERSRVETPAGCLLP